MGCFKSKTKAPPEFPKTVPEASRELRPSEIINNERGKITRKKGKVAKYRFDPEVTEKYEIKALIGRGSFSRVVRVEHKESKQPYAIKVIEVREGKEVFESEITVLRKVKHPNIVQLHEVFECPDKVYVVMELATGGELFDRIVSKGYFTEREATQVLFMVFDGVRYLHSLEITHRDLKPENLLYYHPGNDSRIMITDFGLSNSRQNADDRIMHTTCGTPEYLAPEMFTKRSYTNSVDIWAIGVITFILLSGQMPFADESRARLYRAIRKAKYSYSGEPWKDVSDTAKDFIDKLLVLDPEKRLTAEEAIKHPWIASSAASSSQRNLHRSFSQNWRKHSLSRINSAKSNRSQRSSRSIKSGRSVYSLRRTVHSPCQKERSSVSSPRERKVAPSTAETLTQGRTTVSRDVHVKLSKQLFELPSVIAETEGECQSNHKAAMDNETLLSRHESPYMHEKEARSLSCFQNEIVVPCALERSNGEKENASTETLSIVEHLPSRDGSEPALKTMRDNFFCAYYKDEQQHQVSTGYELGSQNGDVCRLDKLEGNMAILEHPAKSRVHPSPIPRTNKLFCAEY